MFVSTSYSGKQPRNEPRVSQFAGTEPFAPPIFPTASVADLKLAASMIAAAKRPLILLGRHKRIQSSWDARVCLRGSLRRARHLRSEMRNRLPKPAFRLRGDGGGGIGSTPGITVGAALALKGTGRIPVAVLGDGDLLMGSQALWTAAARQLPALFIVNNNRSFYNDVEHQETVAKQRNRPVENKFIGVSIDEPPVDLGKLAQSYGLTAFGPVMRIEDLIAFSEMLLQRLLPARQCW